MGSLSSEEEDEDDEEDELSDDVLPRYLCDERDGWR